MSQKTSREYWAKREAEQLKHNTKNEREYQRQLNAIYEEMMDNINAQINDFYIRYAKKEGITMAEARKRVAKLDMEKYERKAAKYVKEKDFSKRANEEMRLYNLTMKVSRLELLKANIGLELVSGFDGMQKYFDMILNDRTMAEFRRHAGILGKSVLNNARAARVIVNASFHNATFSDRIWMHQDLLKNDLHKLLSNGLIQGKNPRVLAKELQKRFGVSRYQAERLMVTEMSRVQTEAQKLSYERNGFTQYQFLALSTACSDCLAINGKVFEVKKMQPGLNAPPMHPICHCSTAAYMDDKEYDAWLDSYGEHHLSFEEWKKRRKDGKGFTDEVDSDIIKTEKQLGRKIGKHAQDYGLDPSKEADRIKMVLLINEIINNPDEIAHGEWRGQPGVSDFYIQGDDVVVVNNGEFVTILKGGVNNARIKNAREQEI